MYGEQMRFGCLLNGICHVYPGVNKHVARLDRVTEERALVSLSVSLYQPLLTPLIRDDSFL